MEKSEFSQEMSEELSVFLSELKDVMSSAGNIAKMISDKAAIEWMDLEDEFLSFQDEVKNNQSIFLAGSIIGAIVALHFYC